MNSLLVEHGFERHRDRAGAGPFTAAVFDFDGTISLLRGGWTGLMIEMMVASLDPLRRQGETPAELTQTILDFILEQNGRPTLYQMIRLTEEMAVRGGQPDLAEVYEQEFGRRLRLRIEERKSQISAAQVTADDWMVPGVRPFLQALAARGVELTLASGTYRDDVVLEAEFLGIADLFEGRIFGPTGDPRSFSKAAVIAEVAARQPGGAAAVIGFGDGVVETREMHQAGGYAVGIASDEEARSGVSVPWKRDRLIEAGASLVAPDFRNHTALSAWMEYLEQSGMLASPQD